MTYTDAPKPWRYAINYGPDGEENYANVYDSDGQFVGNLRTHHAIDIVRALSAPLQGEPGDDLVGHPCGCLSGGGGKSHRSYVYADGRQHYCERCGEKIDHADFSNIPADYVVTHDAGNYNITADRIAALTAEVSRLTKGNVELQAALDADSNNPWRFWRDMAMAVVGKLSAAEAANADLQESLEKSIRLTPQEVQSGFDRVRWAEGLIRRLPENHDGRNLWLLNYGRDSARAALTTEASQQEAAMSERLTEAQRSYMEAAALRPLSFSEIRGGPSVKCVNDLVSRGLLRRDVDRREWRITTAGRAELTEAKP